MAHARRAQPGRPIGLGSGDRRTSGAFKAPSQSNPGVMGLGEMDQPGRWRRRRDSGRRPRSLDCVRWPVFTENNEPSIKLDGQLKGGNEAVSRRELQGPIRPAHSELVTSVVDATKGLGGAAIKDIKVRGVPLDPL